MYFLYRTLTWLACAAAPFYAVAVLLRRPAERLIVAERFGLGRRPRRESLRGGIWMQAASVGELQVAGLLAPRLAAVAGGRNLGLSVTTPAALRLVQDPPKGVDQVFTFPLDLPPVARRMARTLHPDLFVAVETELWPNLFAALQRQGVPIALVNGRISDRGMERYLRVRSLISRTLNSVHLVCARSDEDAGRFAELGMNPSRIQVTGDLKMDRPAPGPGNLEASLGHLLAGRRVLVAGSTHPGEEEMILVAGRQAAAAGTAVTVILAPRHLQRLADLRALLQTAGLPWIERSRVVRDTRLAGGNPQVILLDTHGELAALYSLAHVAFLGGTLVTVGGHNPLEAAACGLPQVTGPHLSNVRDTARSLRAAGALHTATDATEAAAILADLLQDAQRSRSMGAAAEQLLAGQRGALERTVMALAALLTAASEGSRG